MYIIRTYYKGIVVIKLDNFLYLTLKDSKKS